MINVDGIGTPSSRQSNYIYRDLHLDIELDESTTGESKLSNNIIDQTRYKDIKKSVNELAIKNSLVNLFNTYPGQKLLNPEYGLNLRQFLFTPVSKIIARQIGETILRGINLYEPRVIVKNIDVVSKPDDQEYEITLTLAIPRLSEVPVSFTGLLSESNFNFK